MNKDEQKNRIENDPDYIYCPSCDNSLKKFLVKHPEGVNDEKIAQVLLTVPEKVKRYYDEAVRLIKKDMGLDEDSE